jgi:hypothetical protein
VCELSALFEKNLRFAPIGATRGLLDVGGTPGGRNASRRAGFGAASADRVFVHAASLLRAVRKRAGILTRSDAPPLIYKQTNKAWPRPDVIQMGLESCPVRPIPATAGAFPPRPYAERFVRQLDERAVSWPPESDR